MSNNILWVIGIILLLCLSFLVMLKCWKSDISIFGGGLLRLKVSEPRYTMMVDGKLHMDVRLDKMPFNNIKVGDSIIMIRARPKDELTKNPDYNHPEYKFTTTVKTITKYENIEALLKSKGVKNFYPDATASEAVAMFSEYLPTKYSVSSPVIAIEFQPHKKLSTSKSLAYGRKEYKASREHKHLLPPHGKRHDHRNNETYNFADY